MPLYNGADYVGDAIHSILAQSYQDFELLVIDDGSEDAGPALVRAIADARVRLLDGRTHAGIAAARNRGLSEARGSRIAFFDSDDLAAPGMLEAMMQCMDADGGCDIVTGWSEGVDERGQPTNVNSTEKIADEAIAPSLLFRNCIVTSALLIKRECLEGAAFDETLEVASDYDLWARIIPGRRTRQLRRSLVRYRSHPGNISHRKRALAQGCLRRIHARQLSRLGVEASDADLTLHARLADLTFGTSKETVLAAEAWLLNLEAANARAGLYPAPAFRKVLGAQWYRVCHSAGGNGFWTWRRYFAAPLFKWSSPTGKERYDLLRLTARGALRNLLRPRRQRDPLSST